MLAAPIQNIVNLTLDNFQSVLIDQSAEKLIVIDFWADWCEPCQQLMPVLEKIAADYPDDLILAKVNCDEEQQVAMQFGIRSLPTVMLVKNGQPVDGFAGVQPEGQIRTLLAKHLPDPSEKQLKQAKQLLENKEYPAAANLALQTLEQAPGLYQLKFIAAEALIALQRYEDAEKILATVMMVEQDEEYKALIAKLSLAKEAKESPEVVALQAQLADSPDDITLATKLAIAFNESGQAEEALNLLYSYLVKDLNAGEMKKTYLDILAALPKGNPIASKARSRLYTLLY